MLGKVWRNICLFFSLSKNWLTYGVFWTLMPFGWLYICKWIIGYETSLLKITPDVFLIVAAISVNLVGSIADSSSQPKGMDIIRGFSCVVIALCWGIYLCLFTDFTAKSIFKNVMVTGHIKELHIGIRIALIILTILGCVFKSMEYLASCNKQKDVHSNPAEKQAAETSTNTKQATRLGGKNN